MSTTYNYDMDNLPADHPAGYRRELESWADCFAVRTGTVAGATAAVQLRVRAMSARGRATRDSLVAAAASHSVPAELAKLPNWLPATDISERGALAVAAAAMSAVMGLRLREVTLKGDRGDFWIEDQAGTPRGLCEMSGTQAGSLKSLYEMKRTQVLGNSNANECYVSVSRFKSRESYFCRVR